MNKKILTLALAAVTVLLLLAPAVMAEDNTPDSTTGYYYVKTENGKGLYVRDNPNGRIVGSLKYGTRIYVDCFTTPQWALITYKYDKPGYGVGEYAAWVSTRYLTRKNPGKYSPSATAAPAAAKTDASKALKDMNAEFKTLKQVEKQYSVYARPTRASGWVNLRWAPSTEAERIATCPQNKKLTVLAEGKNWYQVKDPTTGMIGFINKKFVSK